MRKRKQRLNHGSKHHIIPSSRHGSNDPSNIAIVDGKRHNLYHQLFANKTPDEIIIMLKTEFWRGGANANLPVL